MSIILRSYSRNVCLVYVHLFVTKVLNKMRTCNGVYVLFTPSVRYLYILVWSMQYLGCIDRTTVVQDRTPVVIR